MKIEEAIKVAAEMNAWYRSESDNGFTDPQPHDTEKCCLANDVLIAHAKRTTWQPIETLPEDAENVLLCVKGGLYVTNGVRHDDDKQWDVFSDPAYGTIEDLKKVYGFWMPAINPPKEGK